MAVNLRPREGATTLTVSEVYFRASVEQEPHSVFVALHGGVREGCSSVVVLKVRVGVSVQ